LDRSEHCALLVLTGDPDLSVMLRPGVLVLVAPDGRCSAGTAREETGACVA
jgi:hypothetical protein